VSLPFPSDEWLQALHAELNESKAYRAAAAKWEGDLCFVVTAGPGIPQDTYLYMDLWHGECRNAKASDEPVNSEFTISAPLPTWKKVIQGQLDPIRAIMGRQLKLKGPMAKVLKSPKAAVELVNCAKTLDTEWPA
jgi:putative sterol carrier protein